MSSFARRIQRVSKIIPATPVGGPVGVSWGTPIFEDNFDGAALDTSRWAPKWSMTAGDMQNNVVTSPSNVSVSGGYLRLTPASSTSGASINTAPNGGSPNPFTFTYGYAEARIYFPGSGTSIYNWPAWWTVGLAWPGNGENDIAEGIGTMTVNYHGNGVNTGDTIPGIWSNAFHTYGLYRHAGWCDVYYDGVWVKGYVTNDGGAPHSLVLNVGSGYGPARYGTEYQMLVDYVRVWAI